MKINETIFLLLCVVTSINSYTQNLVTNGTFVSCKPNVSCTAGQGHFNQVADWGSFGSGNHFGTGSTPDWYEDINAPNGSHVAGIFENEGIYFDFGSGGLKTSLYRLSFWAEGFDQNATLNINPTHGVSCFLSTVPPSELNCTDFAGGDVYLLERISLSTSATWAHIEFIFPVYNGVVPYRYLVFGSYRNGECNRYVQIANVSVEEDCCGEFMKYQNCDFLPKYTSRQDFVKAGYDVGCVWQPVGNVTVKNGQNVTFQSGNYVDIEPGFSIEPGAIFTSQIGPCGNVPANALDDTNLIGYTTGVFFTCDGSINNAGFSSTGFSYFRVRIFDRWGEKVFDMMGHIDELYQVYTSGDDIWTDISQGEFVVQLELFNCSYSKLEAFSLFYEYVDPCVSAMFKRDLNIAGALASPENKNGEDVKLYPNPAANSVNLCYTVNNDQNVHFVIYNQLGQIVYEKDNIPILNKNQMHVISTDKLVNGIYYLALYKEGKKYLKQFIIEK